MEFLTNLILRTEHEKSFSKTFRRINETNLMRVGIRKLYLLKPESNRIMDFVDFIL